MEGGRRKRYNKAKGCLEKMREKVDMPMGGKQLFAGEGEGGGSSKGSTWFSQGDCFELEKVREGRKGGGKCRERT